MATTMDTAFPRRPGRDAVGDRWFAFFFFQTAASVVAFVSHLAFSPRRRHPRLGIPAAIPTFSPLLSYAGMVLLSLAFLLSASPHPAPPPLPRRLLAAAIFVAAGSLCGGATASPAPEDADWFVMAGLVFRGAVFGLVFAAHYFGRRRWLLQFPVVQRPLFYSFKMGLLSSGRRAMKVSFQAFFLSLFLMLFLPEQFRIGGSIGSQVKTQIRIFIAITVVSLCWEISHHFVQVVHTRRCSFAPPQSTAAAETNPSEFILETLEQSDPRSLMQYLAYLDLCMVSESTMEPWRRAAFFEESGETYKRIMKVCLKPLEQFTSELAAALEGFSSDKPEFLSQQLNPPMDVNVHSKLYEAFNDSQICTWCARTLAALTARSRQEDRYGVAQLTGCNTAVVSTLLSALLAVEACLGKKTNPQPAHLLGPASIRWANFTTGRKDNVTAIASKQRGDLHSKAYAMADVLRTSIYQIVSAFLDDMQANAKASRLEKNWISEERKPSFGSRAVLVQKLCLFLEYHAV